MSIIEEIREKAKNLLGAEFAHAIKFANSYERMPVLFHHMPWIDNSEQFRAWLAVLGCEWSSCDNVGSYAEFLCEPLDFALSIGLNGLMMTDDERHALAQLPDEITVYRGCYEFNADGLSWTTCRNIAEGFTRLARYNEPDRAPILLSRTVKRADVIAYKLDRNELEVILLPESYCIT